MIRCKTRAQQTAAKCKTNRWDRDRHRKATRKYADTHTTTASCHFRSKANDKFRIANGTVVTGVYYQNINIWYGWTCEYLDFSWQYTFSIWFVWWVAMISQEGLDYGHSQCQLEQKKQSEISLFFYGMYYCILVLNHYCQKCCDIQISPHWCQCSNESDCVIPVWLVDSFSIEFCFRWNEFEYFVHDAAVSLLVASHKINNHIELIDVKQITRWIELLTTMHHFSACLSVCVFCLLIKRKFIINCNF